MDQVFSLPTGWGVMNKVLMNLVACYYYLFLAYTFVSIGSYLKNGIYIGELSKTNILYKKYYFQLSSTKANILLIWKTAIIFFKTGNVLLTTKVLIRISSAIENENISCSSDCVYIDVTRSRHRGKYVFE